jgi:hypothetical protein
MHVRYVLLLPEEKQQNISSNGLAIFIKMPIKKDWKTKELKVLSHH